MKSINILHQLHPYSSFDHAETPYSFVREFGGFTSFFPVFTRVSEAYFFERKGVLFLPFPFCCRLCFSQTDLRQVSFLPSSVDCTLVFFPTSAPYKEKVVVFAELGLVDLASLVFCFKIESNGFSLAAFTILPDKTVWVAEVNDVGS
jgi:hypothetical protein